MSSPRRIASLLAVTFAVLTTPAFGTHELVVLPGGAEVCLNGARFTGKVYDDFGTVLGTPITGSVFGIASDPQTHTFSAVGDWARFEVRYPPGTFLVGALADLYIESSSGSFGEFFLPVQDCSFVENGDFTSNTDGWTLSGAVERLTTAEFAHGDGDPDGPFLLLTTKHPSSPVNSGDVDGNFVTDYDRADASQEFHPLHPCQLFLTLGFYTSEAVIDNVDDFVRVRYFNGTNDWYLALSVPGDTGSSYSDWPFVFDSTSRSVASLGVTNGSAFTRGGGAVHVQVNPPILGDVDASIEFDALDQEDALVDTGLLVDSVECRSLLIFGASFETGWWIEWDAAVGYVP